MIIARSALLIVSLGLIFLLRTLCLFGCLINSSAISFHLIIVLVFLRGSRFIFLKISKAMEASPSTGRNFTSTTTITDLDVDSLVHCASYLSLRDISSLAMSCKYLKRVSYSDSIWLRLSREHWLEQISSSFPETSSMREAYMGRLTASQQFKFFDPLVADFYTDAKPCNYLYMNRNDIIFSQGSLVRMMRIDSWLSGRDSLLTMNDHHARITCMRLFPLRETSLFRSETQRNENVLVTSSCDHSIRLWWKGSCQRCFRGHNGPVSTLSDKLLGDGSGKIFASGGVDATVRLWSLSSGGKRGQHALKATLYGHEKPVVLMSVAGHKPSLLVSISKNSKLRVWDTTASSAVRSSCCVGFASLPGAPLGMKCHESLVYVAAGFSVVAIDLRTMQKVFTAAIHRPELQSFEILPSKSLICTGGIDRAMLWDIRRCSAALSADAVAELDGHTGAVTHLHMDPYKIVTGGQEDSNVNVWEADTGTWTNSLICVTNGALSSGQGCSALAVNGCRIVTASCGEEQGIIRYRDFTNATCHVSLGQGKLPASKFWRGQSYSDSEGSDN